MWREIDQASKRPSVDPLDERCTTGPICMKNSCLVTTVLQLSLQVDHPSVSHAEPGNGDRPILCQRNGGRLLSHHSENQGPCLIEHLSKRWIQPLDVAQCRHEYDSAVRYGTSGIKGQRRNEHFRYVDWKRTQDLNRDLAACSAANGCYHSRTTPYQVRNNTGL